MAQIEVDIDTTLPPERVLAALTDFSERRPEIWPGITPDLYEVYSLGETSADVKEGTAKPILVWARELYDWSQPGVVKWTVKESNFSSPGDNVVAEVRPHNGGTRVHVTWNRTGANLKGMLIVLIMQLTKGKPIVDSVRPAFEKLEAEQP